METPNGFAAIIMNIPGWQNLTTRRAIRVPDIGAVLANSIEPWALAIRRFATLNRFMMTAQGDGAIAFTHWIGKSSKAVTEQVGE